MSGGLGFAGRIAAAFIDSKLTQLVVVAALLLGALAVLATPREEEPQIVVPMADVIVEMPGASTAEMETRVTIPMEKKLAEIPGVEYLYSTTSPGRTSSTTEAILPTSRRSRDTHPPEAGRGPRWVPTTSWPRARASRITYCPRSPAPPTTRTRATPDGWEAPRKSFPFRAGRRQRLSTGGKMTLPVLGWS